MEEYLINYVVEKINESFQIAPDGFSSIIFLLTGNDTAIIFNNIPLNADRKSFELLNRPNEKININIPLSFDGVGNEPEIVLIKVYYEKIQ